MIYGILLGLHLVVCISLIFTVLLQSGKGGGLAGAFGGGGGAGQTLFGGRGAATFLSKATTALGVAFMTTSLVLALMSGGQNTPRSILRESPAPGTTPPPVTSEPIQIPGSESFTLPPVGDTPPGDPAASEGLEVTPVESDAPAGAADEEGQATGGGEGN